MAPRKSGAGKSAAVPETTGEKQEHGSVATRFKPGQSGNPAGRPKSSRNKLGEAFIEALHDDFAENGAAAIKAAREESPLGYVKVCASILPRDLNVNINPLEELTDEQLIERIRQLEDAVTREIGTGAAAGGAEAAVADKPAASISSVH